MGQEVYINFDVEDLKSARCRGADDLRGKKFAQFIAGDSTLYDLYLTGTSGLRNIQDYAAIRMGVGNLNQRPESGTYTIDGVGGTLAYNHSASELETAIETITGNACTVVELTPFVFKVSFDAVGSQTVPSIDSRNLSPASSVTATVLIEGDATTKESWLWRIYRNALAFTDSFTNITGQGVQGTLSLATAGIYDLLANQSNVSTFFEVEVTDTSGNVQTIAQIPIKLNGEVIGTGFEGQVPSARTIDPSAVAFLNSFPLSSAVDSMLKASDASGIRSEIGAVNYPYTTDFISGTEQTRNLTSITNSSGYTYNTNLTSIYVGSNVTSIGSNAFNSCSSLTSITITDNVTTIGDGAFGYSGITSITIPDSVISIGSDAFTICSVLTSVDIGNSVTSIGNSAFFYCVSLSSITIPDSVTRIRNATFFNCTSLTDVNIGDGVTSIDINAFNRCSSLTSIIIPNSVTSIDDNAFKFSGLTSIVIPDSVALIGASAFQSCSSLTSVTIEEGATTIGNFAFADCTSLTRIDCLATNAPTIGTATFSGSAATEIHVPVGATGYGSTYGGLTVVYDL